MLGGVAGVALYTYGVAQDWIERRKSADGSSPAFESTDVDYLKIPRARIERDVETLIAALGDEIEASLAAISLGKLGAVSAIPALVPLLEARDPQAAGNCWFVLSTIPISASGGSRLRN